ncbi:hypothetical protein MLD38_004519 [Melastoma candidum]|uniref:Uncharacterized protein n=1 Tax=Melastoma candidum TaxID=119954 RepID=A0ACB9S992_9MYRT|nr:hypothetical protein MLD38_004519 [Melastoma candidum]
MYQPINTKRNLIVGPTMSPCRVDWFFSMTSTLTTYPGGGEISSERNGCIMGLTGCVGLAIRVEGLGRWRFEGFADDMAGMGSVRLRVDWDREAGGEIGRKRG